MENQEAGSKLDFEHQTVVLPVVLCIDSQPQFGEPSGKSALGVGKQGQSVPEIEVREQKVRSRERHCETESNEDDLIAMKDRRVVDDSEEVRSCCRWVCCCRVVRVFVFLDANMMTKM